MNHIVKKPMPKEICCRNWVQLFKYIEETPNFPSGLSGRSAIEKVLVGLVDNPDFLIQDPDDPERFYKVKENHLKDEKYWHSNEFSLILFENASRAIGGFRPLFSAGVVAGYRIVESAQPKHFQFLRLLSPGNLLKLVSLINKRFNKTKNPKCVENKIGYAKIELHYKEQFRNYVSKHVCDWNAGIYTGMGKYTGGQDFIVTESNCLNDRGNDCVFEIHWTHLNLFKRLLIFGHSIVDPDYIIGRDLDNLILNELVIRQEGIISTRTTELKQTQAKLIEAEKRTLEHRITGGFAHEMRNALTGAQLEFKSVMGTQGNGKSTTDSLKDTATTLLRNINEIHEKYKIPREEVSTLFIPQLKSISQTADHLSTTLAGVSKDLDRGLLITTQIRDYAKLSELRPGNDLIDIVPTLKEVGTRYQQDFNRIGIFYSVEGLDKAVVKADTIHIDSIFSNLLKNAIDALEEHETEDQKTITVRIEDKTEEDKKHLIIKIQDNGPGILDEHINEIFEPFFSTKPSSGTGLGLGIVKKLIQLYGWQIDVDSKRGQGTSFNVKLPLTLK